MLWYTLARIGLFLAAAAVLFAFGVRGWIMIVLAFLISGALSLFVLGKLRDAVSVQVSQRVEQRRARRAEAQAAEDDLL